MQLGSLFKSLKTIIGPKEERSSPSTSVPKETQDKSYSNLNRNIFQSTKDQLLNLVQEMAPLEYPAFKKRLETFFTRIHSFSLSLGSKEDRFDKSLDIAETIIRSAQEYSLPESSEKNTPPIVYLLKEYPHEVRGYLFTLFVPNRQALNMKTHERSLDNHGRFKPGHHPKQGTFVFPTFVNNVYYIIHRGQKDPPEHTTLALAVMSKEEADHPEKLHLPTA